MRYREATLPDGASWYATGLRRLGELFAAAADYLDRRGPGDAPVDPMPRHTSFDEVVGDMRNRIHCGFGVGQRPYD
jgi:hypothetical protein